MLIIFTGNGKGKTTAALGCALRAVGEGQKVLMVQFIKGSWESGEDNAARRLAPEFRIVKMGQGFVGIQGDDLPRKVHEDAALYALEYARQEIERGRWDMVILDEIHNAIHLGLIGEREAGEFLGWAKPRVAHLVFTGRDAPQKFIDEADIVTEMREVKHPYREGVVAQKGIEY